MLFFTALAILSCDDDSDELEKQKENRYLRQYLESNNISIEPESNGLYYISNQEGTGISPGINDWVIIRYTLSMINGKILDTTDEELAIKTGIYSKLIIYGDKRIALKSIGVKGVQDGLIMMKEGATATFIIPSHLAYGKVGTSAVPPYTTLISEIELIKVINDPVEYEQLLIDNYLSLYSDSTNLVIEKRESGLYYIEIEKGEEGNKPEENDEVSVYYTASLTDGRVFDSNKGSTVFKFILGEYQTVPGFEEGISIMNRKGKSRILVPSSLGYGIVGSDDVIVGYTPLVFDIELADIHKQ